MRGLIVLWSGAIETIPTGWQNCDGTNGTPDLNNVLVVGAGDSYAPGDQGGALDHTHDIGSWDHSHRIDRDGELLFGGYKSTVTSRQVVTYTVWEESNLPPWHRLYYIMKL